MHLALQISEILLDIFSHWQAPYSDFSEYTGREPLKPADLATLARTCRAFKEPALDVLWSVLADLTPVVRCIPPVCYQIHPHSKSRVYGLCRPLEQADWDTLQGYTHRVRSVHDFASTFHQVSDDIQAQIFLRPPTSDPLFPNLRHLRHLYYGIHASEFQVLFQPLLSLISVTYVSRVGLGRNPNPSLFENHLKSLTAASSNLGRLTMDMTKAEVMIDSVVCDFICGWSNPRIVSCPQVTLNIDAFKRLSRASSLAQLSFMLDATLADRITRWDALCFTRLQKLELRSESLISVSNLLARIQLPALTDLSVIFKDLRTPQNVATFLELLRRPGNCNAIRTLELWEFDPRLTSPTPGSERVLVGDDLRPLMELKNLRRLDLNLKWNIGLTDDDLVELVSAWPHLEHLLINQEWGWRQSSGGITPDGIIRLLQTRSSLRELALAVDTRSFVGPSLGLDLSRSLSIDIVDSAIEAASIPVMVAFFTHLTALMPSGTLELDGWRSPGWRNKDHCKRWLDVFTQAREVVPHCQLWLDFW